MLWLCGIIFQSAAAFPELKKDSSNVVVRTIPSKNLDTYKADKNFQYQQQVPEGMNVWDRFWRWFWQKVGALMENNGVKIGLKVLMYVAPVVIFIFAILRFMGMEKVMLWISGNKSSNLPFDIHEEDIYGINFNEAIDEAVAQGRFRDATRLHYLKTLRALSDLGRINWNKHKTNVDFAHDLSGTPLSTGFSDITRLYEYAWYGEFQVSGAEYDRVKEHFLQFEKQIVS
jgi:Domain of unknown function (DUF4129)